MMGSFLRNLVRVNFSFPLALLSCSQTRGPSLLLPLAVALFQSTPPPRRI